MKGLPLGNITRKRMMGDRTISKIGDLYTELIMTDLETAPVACTAPVYLVESWIQHAGLHPGTARISNSELWQQYKSWHYKSGYTKANLPHVNTFAKVMAARFKAWRSKNIRGYLISPRSNEQVIAALLQD